MSLFYQIILIVSCAAIESLAVWFFLAEGITSRFVFLHVLAAVCFVYYLYRRGQDNLWRDKYLPLTTFGFLLFTFFPGVGPVGLLILLAYVEYSRSPHGRRVFEEYEKYISEKPPEGMALDNALKVLRQFRFELGFEPFVDILLGNKPAFKATVIRKLSEQISVNNIQLLQLALKDSRAEIRLYAAGALMKIETRLNEQIRKTARRIKAGATYKEYTQLGDLYRMYSSLNPSGGTLTRHYIRQSADNYEKSLDLNTNQPQAIAHYCRLLISLEEVDRARHLIDRAVKIWPENPDIVFLCNEVYFEMREFDRLPQRFLSVSEDNLDDTRKQVKRFWLESAAGKNI